MTEFKQIIGRGTRVRDDYGKLWFNILDYTGSATRLFADPDFDGEPVQIYEPGEGDPIAPGHLAPYAGNSGLGFFQPQSEEKIYKTQNRTHDVPAEDDEEDEIFLWMHGVADGVRTHDNRNHNPAQRMVS